MANFDLEFLKRCRNVTNYYLEKNHGNWPLSTQILKMYEEVGEVQRAPRENELLTECCDVILATITMFDLLGIPFERIQEIMDDTLHKVEKRITLGVESS